MNPTSFTRQDYIAAKQSYADWEGRKFESTDEYILRKRKIELNALVNKVIENELSETDKLIVRLHWNDGLTVSKIAEICKMDKSSITRRMNKINDTIYDKLKYAMEYRYGKDYSGSVKVIIKNKDGLCCFIPPKDTGDRIKNLRLNQSMSADDVSTMTGISEKRLNALESGDAEATAGEIRKIATAFRITSDYILFGKIN